MRRQGFHAIVYIEASLARARQSFECFLAICNRLEFSLIADKFSLWPPRPASCGSASRSAQST